MSPLLIISVILFTIAMVIYTIAVFTERRARNLAPRHIRLFFAGVSADTLATYLTYKAVGGLVFTPHAIMGFISLGLMMLHLGWATITLKRGNTNTLKNFHKLSLFVWCVWMISYLSGFGLGMMKL